MFGDLIDTIGYVADKDPEVGAAMKDELARQRRNIELIASENIVSPRLWLLWDPFSQTNMQRAIRERDTTVAVSMLM